MSNPSLLGPFASPRWPGPLELHGILEPSPGPRWQAMFRDTWESYRGWYLREGEDRRPSLVEGRRMLDRHMPELLPTWERLGELAGGDETAARMLTLWNPPAFLPGCAQAVLAGERPLLVRNYDYAPELFEGVVYSSRLTGRRVIGTSDCLWGLLDGMNDAGLVVSLAFGGRPGFGSGFGIPLVLRYLLEVADTVADVRRVLARVPVNMAYNLTVLDGNADAGTFFVAPGAAPEFFPEAVATNHRGSVPEFAARARALRSVERQQVLLAAAREDRDDRRFVGRFLEPPLYNTAYDRGFGTLYTAVYRPHEACVDYVWPSSTWRRSFDTPSGRHTVSLTPTGAWMAGTGTGASGAAAAPVIPALTGFAGSADTSPVTGRKAGPGRDPHALAEEARSAIGALAESVDPEAFHELLGLSQYVGECLGVSARNLAAAQSWAGVAAYAGTTRQAAWARWGRADVR